MSWGLHKVYTVTMTSGALSSTTIDLGRAFRNVYLEVPTMASGSLYLMGGTASGGTYRRIMNVQANTSTVTHSTFTVDSLTTGKMVPVPSGFQFMKVESTSGCTDVVTTFNFICSD